MLQPARPLVGAPVFQRADEPFWFTHDIRGELPWEVNSWLLEGTFTTTGRSSSKRRAR